MKEGWNSLLWSEIDGNCIYADGFGAIWKIFSQTSHMRPEAKVYLRGHMTNLTKWYQINPGGHPIRVGMVGNTRWIFPIAICIGMLSEVAEFQTLKTWKNQNEVDGISQFLPYAIHKYAIWRHSDMLVNWPLRSTLASGLWEVWLNIFQIAPKPFANIQFPSISDHRWLFQPSFIISPLSLFLASGL